MKINLAIGVTVDKISSSAIATPRTIDRITDGRFARAATVKNSAMQHKQIPCADSTGYARAVSATRSGSYSCANDILCH